MNALKLGTVVPGFKALGPSTPFSALNPGTTILYLGIMHQDKLKGFFNQVRLIPGSGNLDWNVPIALSLALKFDIVICERVDPLLFMDTALLKQVTLKKAFDLTYFPPHS